MTEMSVKDYQARFATSVSESIDVYMTLAYQMGYRDGLQAASTIVDPLAVDQARADLRASLEAQRT